MSTSSDLRKNSDIRRELGLRPVINVSGTMTALGASICVPEAVAMVTAILPQFVEIDQLQAKASAVIARLTGGEAGCISASASAGITTSVAACMSGCDRAKIEQLPDTSGMQHDVVIQSGHMVGYGAPLEQAIRITGASVIPVGQATDARPYQLEGKLNERTAAAVYVVSHHAVDYGQLPLALFCEICRRHEVPVIVDAASEYDLRGFLEQGADLVVYSAHKFLGGPTAGIITGRLPLVRAAYLQNYGIGRGMKVGKEGIAGAMAALQAWEQRDHEGIRRRESSYLQLWYEAFSGRPGVRVEILPDPTDNPLERLRLHLDSSGAHIAAWELAVTLAAGDPPVIVRDHLVEQGFFDMDPCNLHPGEAEVVAERVCAGLEAALAQPQRPRQSFIEYRAARATRLSDWPYQK